MKTPFARCFAISLVLCVLSVARVAQASQEPRILALGGSVTEIIYALGEEDRLIARDATSTYPSAATALPDVGYLRALSPEGILSVNPTLIISEEGAGPPETIDVLNEAAITFVTIPDAHDRAGILAKVEAVGAALGVPGKAADLARELDTELQRAEKRARGITQDPKRVMFILSTQGGRIMAAGTNTAAQSIIEMSGGVNAIDCFEGYKQVTDEAVSAAAPDVILMMDRGGGHGASNDKLFAMPAIMTTPAAEDRAVIRMDGLFILGFGPRTAAAAMELNELLYGS
ncbi:hemin ABC transporter substrate-binding protein [Roseobacter denitrificans]|uniref:Hemin ABC transporter, periplasmic hemin-binding protein n=1 Tax=Roseobacter denitrificans (strain ATCC 33942 / OCh 114) TaxID=375451 RepID=Q160G6_ROSDO|nr:ABC transporter substrate-binding protein [Roseobacter denitrificans]ABG33627.1 hemin ABC transporter, periplasmic hemin-binding protein [Roseobacter denitrificans OCh 114]AVL52924.1 hemin ABC transporter substrate-binding protein [Roseobacter denitrificans]SFG03427.1 iron complex transport system substrate-binding protein [Roseobacter denitrificans OCh 114]